MNPNEMFENATSVKETPADRDIVKGKPKQPKPKPPKKEVKPVPKGSELFDELLDDFDEELNGTKEPKPQPKAKSQPHPKSEPQIKKSELPPTKKLFGRNALNRDENGLVPNDYEVLNFIAPFKVATTEIVMNITGTSQRNAGDRLRKLYKRKLIKFVMGGDLLRTKYWFLTNDGLKLTKYADEKFKVITKTTFPSQVPHLIEVNTIASYFYNAELKELYSEYKIKKPRVQLEHQGRKAKAPNINRYVMNKLDELQEWVDAKWNIYYTNNVLGTCHYHTPDLVIMNYEKPKRATAIEVERTDKSKDKKALKTMKAYKIGINKGLYKKVIWITPIPRVAKKLEKARADAKLDENNCIIILENKKELYKTKELINKEL